MNLLDIFSLTAIKTPNALFSSWSFIFTRLDRVLLFSSTNWSKSFSAIKLQKYRNRFISFWAFSNVSLMNEHRIIEVQLVENTKPSHRRSATTQHYPSYQSRASGCLSLCFLTSVASMAANSPLVVDATLYQQK
jgi:hypothetical protein